MVLEQYQEVAHSSLIIDIKAIFDLPSIRVFQIQIKVELEHRLEEDQLNPMKYLEHIPNRIINRYTRVINKLFITTILSNLIGI